MLKPVGEAIRRWNMIREGDRVLLGLSGGKDSMALLLVLRHLHRASPVRFELGVANINPLTDSYDPEPLHEIVQSLGLPFHMAREDLLTRARKHIKNASYCSFCSRLKRGLLYQIARTQGYNVLALAHHQDDIAQSFLMSAFYNGKLWTMAPNYAVREGDLRVIRPMALVRERQNRAYVAEAGIPVIEENCPACLMEERKEGEVELRMPTTREHIKALLAREELEHPRLMDSLMTAMGPLLDREGAE
ncbi:MAG: tRNA 2-thiocytidine(32) synthetase TtcA [Proteobacteria bacterium CG1_02_64_396]|nr:MAG: tRNA 2-thiocytidine(32) synthetase TtcA [Proteobacteria bacterium CG1_02_64_396]